MSQDNDLVFQLIQKVESIGASQKVLDANFNDIRRSQTEIMNKIGRMEERYDLLFSELRLLCDEVRGNGRLGLVSKVNAIIWIGSGVAAVTAMVITKILMVHFGFPV